MKGKEQKVNQDQNDRNHPFFGRMSLKLKFLDTSTDNMYDVDECYISFEQHGASGCGSARCFVFFHHKDGSFNQVVPHCSGAAFSCRHIERYSTVWGGASQNPPRVLL